MTKYQYSPLSQSPNRPDSIRLLRLLPEGAEPGHEPGHEPGDIKCELFEYPLQSSGRNTHLYEALSYVWGDPQNRRLIYVDGQSLLVTANLYAALLHLRDRFLARIIWIDAICIDQDNHPEKAKQIQLMSKIYGLAQRVVVWLGEGLDDGELAIEQIRVTAGKKPIKTTNKSSKDEKTPQTVIKLLQRPWFERIWVLQEVAAARHVLIKCGSAEIDGHAFCLGVDSLSLDGVPDLQSVIHSVTYLISGAIFRPKYETSGSGIVSLDICPLGSLVDMYHTRNATDRRDKVFALLNMSSDDPNKTNLSPNYDILWEILVERLTKFLLGELVAIETWTDSELVVIQGKGRILGYVSSVQASTPGSNEQHVRILSNSSIRENAVSRYSLNAPARLVREMDLLCFLQGASEPSIIRLHRDYFSIILVAVTLEEHEAEYDIFALPTVYRPTTEFPRDFLLVWNWDRSLPVSHAKNGHEALVVENNKKHPPEGELDNDLDEPIRVSNVGLILSDLIFESKRPLFERHEHERYLYEAAVRRMSEALSSSKRKFKKEHARTLTRMQDLALLYQKVTEWEKAEAILLEVVQYMKRVNGKDHPHTLLSMANLASVYDRMHFPKVAEKLREMIHLLEQKKENICELTEKECVRIAGSSDIRMMAFLLEWTGAITEAIIEAAIRNEKYENSERHTVMLLLERRGDGIHITERMLEVAAGNWRHGEEITKLLLEQGGDAYITEKVLEKAVGNRKSGLEITKCLLEQGGNVYITEKVLEEAAGNWTFGGEITKLLLEQGGDFYITEKILEKAAKNWIFGKEVMKLLLEEGSGVQITEKALAAAAGNGGQGEDISGLLLEKEKSELLITERVLVAAAKNREAAAEIMKYLLEQGEGELVIRDRTLEAAVENVNWPKLLGTLLEWKGADIQMANELAVKLERKGGGPGRKRLLELDWNNHKLQKGLMEEWEVETDGQILVLGTPKPLVL